MDQQLAQKLLSSMQQSKLVIFCGAGLSMSPPSSLPSAKAVADRCVDAYNASALDPPIPDENKSDLGLLAEYFVLRNMQNFFIHRLVNWNQFTGQHNDGHTAIADFLTCKAIPFAITTNYDLMIERGAEALGEVAFDACLDGDCANTDRDHAPLLKIHGSMSDRDATLWCREQLKKTNPDPANQRLRKRVVSARAWLGGRLLEKDLVFVGFWSEWKHLSKLLMSAIRSVNVPFVLLVDPAPLEQLREKAPDLWRWANRRNIQFKHLPERGADFLAELRRLFSVNFLKRASTSAQADFQAYTGADHIPAVPFDGLDNEDLYSLRQDFCGVPPGNVPRDAVPTVAMTGTAKTHLLLRHAGSTFDGPCHIMPNGRRIRVVNGLTRILSRVRAEFAPKLPPEPKLDYVVCAGAEDDGGVQPNIVRPSDTPTIVRFGDSARWLTATQAHTEGIF